MELIRARRAPSGDGQQARHEATTALSLRSKHGGSPCIRSSGGGRAELGAWFRGGPTGDCLRALPRENDMRAHCACPGLWRCR